MEFLKQTCLKLIDDIQDFAKRFPLTLVFLVLLTVIGSVQVIIEKLWLETTLALIVTTFVSLLFELCEEYEIVKIKFLKFVVCALSCVFTFLITKAYDNVYVYTSLFGICLAITSLYFWVLYKNRPNEKLISHLFKSLFISNIFSSVIYAGISVCLFAVYFLIYSFVDFYKIVTISAFIIEGLFFTILFLSYVPGKDEELEVPEIYRVIIHKGLFFTYLGLIAILYLYILKIIITWKMPVGQLNWFGCFALLFYVFFYLTLEESDGKFQALFKRFGGLLMLPILAIQSYAIFIRVSAYGLTMARYISILLIVAAVSFIVSSIAKFDIRYCFVFASALVLIATCTNLNIYDVPNRMQENRLRNALSKGGVLSGDKIDSTVDMESQYFEEAKSAYDYLEYSPGTKSGFFNGLMKTDLGQKLGNYYYDDEEETYIEYFHKVTMDDLDIDISDFKTLREIDDDCGLVPAEEIERLADTPEWIEAEPYHGPLPLYQVDSDRYIFFTFVHYLRRFNGLETTLSWRGYLLSK